MGKQTEVDGWTKKLIAVMIFIPSNAFTDFTERYEVTQKLDQKQKLRKYKCTQTKTYVIWYTTNINMKMYVNIMYENMYIRFTAIWKYIVPLSSSFVSPA